MGASATSNATCPKCGQRAPIVLRGIEARCTVCGALRVPFTAQALNLAGKPSRFGGGVARFFGWGVLLMGFTFALSAALVLQSIFPSGYVGWAVALPMAMLSLLIGLSLLLGGRKLKRSGDAAQQQARMQAIRALASHRGGSVTAADVARKLALGELEADAMLTELAKDPDQQVALEVDDEGTIHYLFGVGAKALRFEAWSAAPRARIDPNAADHDAAAEQLAVEEQGAAEAAAGPAPAGRSRSHEP